MASYHVYAVASQGALSQAVHCTTEMRRLGAGFTRNGRALRCTTGNQSPSLSATSWGQLWLSSCWHRGCTSDDLAVTRSPRHRLQPHPLPRPQQHHQHHSSSDPSYLVIALALIIVPSIILSPALVLCPALVLSHALVLVLVLLLLLVLVLVLLCCCCVLAPPQPLGARALLARRLKRRRRALQEAVRRVGAEDQASRSRIDCLQARSPSPQPPPTSLSLH